MKQALLENFDVILVVGILVFFGILEVIAGHLKSTKRTGSDWLQELGGGIVLSIIIKPLIVLAVITISSLLWGNAQNTMQSWPIWIAFILFLSIDDFLQYWYHRSAHEYNFLWKLHRPHHQAEEMGFFVSYRNAALYYILMPNIWWMGLVTFLGGAKGVAIGFVLKQLVIVGSHSTVKWDEPLYKSKIFKPIITVLERIIVTPAFHHAHHGKSKIDGISNPNGNFGNMFSIWDQLFNSAFFTKEFPTELGLPNDPKEHWTAAYLYPVVKSNDANSELSKGYIKENTATNGPIIVELEKGKNYLWCRCGKSKTQPFCDASHHGTKFKPILFEAKRTGKVKLCNCKTTKQSPFCDNSHEALDA